MGQKHGTGLAPLPRHKTIRWATFLRKGWKRIIAPQGLDHSTTHMKGHRLPLNGTALAPLHGAGLQILSPKSGRGGSRGGRESLQEAGCGSPTLFQHVFVQYRAWTQMKEHQPAHKWNRLIAPFQGKERWKVWRTPAVARPPCSNRYSLSKVSAQGLETNQNPPTWRGTSCPEMRQP
jgi:hypothetical protein